MAIDAFMRVTVSVGCTDVYRLLNLIYTEQPALLLVEGPVFPGELIRFALIRLISIKQSAEG